MSNQVAVFGGSFNPPHVAHTLVASYVLAATSVDRLLLVPTAKHPFDKQLADFEHRLRMCELAMAPLARVQVSDIEYRLGGESRTLRTLEALARAEPSTRLRLVIGSDLLPETPKWHNFAAIEALAPPIVVQRAGHRTDPDKPCMPEVSSTEVRRRLQAREPTEGLLSPAVAAYIDAHNLYR